MPTLLNQTERSQNVRLLRGTQVPAGALLLSTLVLIAGCNRGHSADVVATVNGHPIMRADMEKAYQEQLGEAQQQQQQTPSPDQADSLRLNVLQSLINEEIIEERAAKMNLTATNDEVDAKVKEAKAPYTDEQWEERLKANHTTLEDFRHDLRRTLTINKLMNKEINSKITITDADVSNYYNAHKAEFNFIETTYHIAQILVTDQPSAQPGNLQNSKATNDAEAKKKIQALKNQLDSGADFGVLAMNFSEQPETAPNGGDMGFVGESQLRSNPTIYAAIMKLKPGETTDIMPIVNPQTQKPAAYAIYKLLSREPAGQRELSDPRVQQAIRQQLQDGRSQLLKGAYFEMLRDQAKIQNFFAEQIFKNDAH